MTLARLALCAALPILSACVPGESADPFAARCQDRDVEGLIGLPASQVTPREGLILRQIGPSSAVTTDVQPSRITVWVGGDGIIDRAYCG